MKSKRKEGAGNVVSAMIRRLKQAQMPAFGWMFAVIVGVMILFFVIYFLGRTIQTETKESESVLAKNFDILLNPFSSIGSSGPISMAKIINLGQESKIKFDCNDYGLGYQTMAIQSKSAFGKYGELVNIDIPDKYIFSEELNGKSFYVLSKSFELPFRIDDLIYILSKSYCFINAPDKIKEQFTGNFDLIKKIRFNDCLEGDIDVCFEKDNCDISVSGNKCEGFFCDNAYEYGIVKKEGKEIGFVTDALMYSAIFSDYKLYECNFNRLMNRLELLIDLHKNKIGLIDPRCDSKMLNSEFSTFKGYINLKNMAQLSISSKNLYEENSELECPIF